MLGAPAFTARAALRAGAGLVRVLAPQPLIEAILQLTPSATGVGLPVDATGDLIRHRVAELLDRQIASCDCLVIGPGFGHGPGQQAGVLRAVVQEDVPVVVDADGLNGLAEIPEFWRDFHATAVLTPHPGEFRRLAATLSISHDPTHTDSRPLAAAAMALRLGCIVVLKGAGTVVSDGLRSWVCGRGHPCLATAGTGDVLAGLLGGLIAQHAGLSSRPRFSLFDIARVAVQAHAIAGEEWASARGVESGLLAPELIDEIPAVLERMRTA
jgi:NAD(P)H-hydrate epimerase